MTGFFASAESATEASSISATHCTASQWQKRYSYVGYKIATPIYISGEVQE